MRSYLSRSSKKQVALQVVLLVGLAVALYLVGQKVILRSKANPVFNAAEVKDAQGNTLDCSSGKCETKTLDVEIRIDKSKLED